MRKYLMLAAAQNSQAELSHKMLRSISHAKTWVETSNQSEELKHSENVLVKISVKP